MIDSIDGLGLVYADLSEAGQRKAAYVLARRAVDAAAEAAKFALSEVEREQLFAALTSTKKVDDDLQQKIRDMLGTVRP